MAQTLSTNIIRNLIIFLCLYYSGPSITTLLSPISIISHLSFCHDTPCGCSYKSIVNNFKSYRMGQSSNNPFRQGGDLMSEYSILERQLDLSLTFLAHKKTRKEYLLREQTYNDLREFAQNSDRLKKRKEINDPHLTNLVRIQERTEDHLCSNFYKIYSLWEYPSKSLADEITARALEKKRFAGTQLWSILAGSIMGLSALQEQEIKHECLTAKSILTDEDGNIKVVDPLAHALLPNIDCVYNNRSIKHIYLSPEQCESVETQKPIINKNPYKNDVFVLGMIMLQCGLLDRQDQCYLNDCSEVNFDRIEANLKKFEELYGEDLAKFVETMLSRDIRSRPDWAELVKYANRNNKNGNDNRASHVPKRDHFITRVMVGDGESKRGHSNQQSIRAVAEPPKSMFYKQQPTYVSPTPYQPQPSTYINLPNQDKVKSNPPPFNPPSSGNSIQLPTRTVPVVFKPQEYSYKHVEQFNPASSSTNPFTVTFSNTQTFQQQATTQLPQLPQAPSAQSYFMPPIQQTAPQMIISQKFVPNFAGTFSKDGLSSIPFANDKQSISSNLTSVLDQRPQETTSNMTQYVRPAQSVNYQINRPHYPSDAAGLPLPQLSHPYAFDPKLTHTPQLLVDTSSLQMQPTFVEEHFKMGSRYEGYKLNGQRHGRGKFFYQDGGSYDGEWRQNKMEGQGTLYYQSDRIAYEGAWVADKFQGFGKLYNEYPQPLNGGFDCTDFDSIDEYWAYYQGNFNEDLKDGHGILKFSNGQTFQGTFRQDMVQGEGVFYCRDGRRVHGIWHENHLEQELQ